MLFNGKARCVTCHQFNGSNPIGTDQRFHNIGVSARHQEFEKLAAQALAVLQKNDSKEEIDRLALETDSPIVPVGIVGGEEQSPALANVPALGRLVGAPAFPITPTFPWLGLGGMLPLPVKFRIHFGAPLRFEGDAGEEDAAIEERVALVKARIRELIADGRAARSNWFW